MSRTYRYMRSVIANLEVEMITEAHHVPALAKASLTNERIVQFFSAS